MEEKQEELQCCLCESTNVPIGKETGKYSRRRYLAFTIGNTKDHFNDTDTEEAKLMALANMTHRIVISFPKAKPLCHECRLWLTTVLAKSYKSEEEQKVISLRQCTFTSSSDTA